MEEVLQNYLNKTRPKLCKLSVTETPPVIWFQHRSYFHDGAHITTKQKQFFTETLLSDSKPEKIDAAKKNKNEPSRLCWFPNACRVSIPDETR